VTENRHSELDPESPSQIASKVKTLNQVQGDRETVIPGLTQNLQVKIALKVKTLNQVQGDRETVIPGLTWNLKHWVTDTELE